LLFFFDYFAARLMPARHFSAMPYDDAYYISTPPADGAFTPRGDVCFRLPDDAPLMPTFTRLLIFLSRFYYYFVRCFSTICCVR